MEKDQFENCDGVLWGLNKVSVDKEEFVEMNSTIFKYQEKEIEPDDLGFKYHVLTFKEDKSYAETVSAYIGDLKYFIDNQAKAGYNGMVVRSKTTPKKTVKKIFEKVLSNFNFPQNQIKQVLKEV